MSSFSSSSSSPRETIQISLGPTANAITAHLLNLQGLTVTSSSSPSSSDVYCDPATTHFVQAGGGTLVPRVLMVDESKHQVPATPTQGGDSTGNNNNNRVDHLSGTNNIFVSPLQNDHNDELLWSGTVQVLGTTKEGLSTTDRSQTPSQKFSKIASSMAYSSYSRYHQGRTCENSGLRFQTDPTNSRHVVWDDDDDDEEEEDPYERHQREQQNEFRWKTQTSQASRLELNRLLQEEFQKGNSNHHHHRESPETKIVENEGFSFQHWTDIWMPPFDEKSKVVLPYSSQSQLVPHWNVSYQRDGGAVPFLQEWKEDVLFERFRHMLEACDYGIQGVSIATEGHGIYASLAGYLLEELKQECKSAARLVYHATDDGRDMTPATERGDNSDNVSFASPSSNSWQEAQVHRIRKQLSRGLALHEFTEKAHAILPLQLSSATTSESDDDDDSNRSRFRATAKIAMALEASTLPFRFHGKTTTTAGMPPAYQIGLQNSPYLAHGSSDTSWGSTARRLTISEFLQVLQPSDSYSMLELDVLAEPKTTSLTNKEVYDFVQQGTTVERDQRTRESRGHGYRTRPRQVLPGTWMQDARHPGSESRGLLSSLSYSYDPKGSLSHTDRSIHHHFALSTAVRPVLSVPSDNQGAIKIGDYLTCLVQSMGIQYRPERSMATILDQSIGQLTFGEDHGGSNYGAGIYWKHLLPEVETPVVAVLGNTTRSYELLNGIAQDMKASMRTPRFRGYYNRDVSNGVLPEMEDCEDALEACWNKCDVYQPSLSVFGMEDDYG